MLADTGLVSAAAKAVGMTRETAYRLRRSAHGAALARAAKEARGAEAWAEQEQGGALSDAEFKDMCRYLDPASRGERSRKRYR